MRTHSSMRTHMQPNDAYIVACGHIHSSMRTDMFAHSGVGGRRPRSSLASVGLFTCASRALYLSGGVLGSACLYVSLVPSRLLGMTCLVDEEAYAGTRTQISSRSLYMR